MISIKIEAELSVSLLAGPRQVILKSFAKAIITRKRGKRNSGETSPIRY